MNLNDILSINQKHFIGKIQDNYNLAKHTWLGVGGKAEFFYIPNSIEELQLLLQSLKKNISVNIIGACSNLIITDNLVKGITIKLANNIKDIKIQDNIITVGAGVKSMNLVKFLKKNNLSNLEFIVGIPGTVGGMIFMNAGCYNHEISEFIKNITVITKNGEIIKLSKNEIKFEYRKSNINKEYIILEADLICKYDEYENINSKIKNITDSRKKSQPINNRTVGSTFKNPDNCNKKAWELIKLSNVNEKIKFKNVRMSDHHYNFLIHNGNGNAEEIKEYIYQVIELVYKTTGIKLETEVQFL